jgi:uracil DNA glycosylase
MTTHDDPLDLAPLFAGGGEPWRPILLPLLTAQPAASELLGPARSKAIVPVRELTFQALKPNAPDRWRVVVFGQSPYPRIESATGIAMFDNSFTDWADAKFGKVTSIRCIVKAAAMREHGVPKQTSTAALRSLIAQHDVVPPGEWFQAMLAQGVLLLNASLTASTDDAVSTTAHAAFWKPVVEAIVDAIIAARAARGEGVVFAWWGSHAKALRRTVEQIAKRHPGARVVHVEHVNPAAQGDAFCDGDPFGAIDGALESLGMKRMTWLPRRGWQSSSETDAADAARLGAFIEETRELHRQYLERLSGAADEVLEAIPPITGILAEPVRSLADATRDLERALPGLARLVAHTLGYADRQAAAGLSRDEIAALHLYTLASAFYKQLNAALRAPDRRAITPYRAYLRLFLSALARLPRTNTPLYRGVARDLRRDYAEGRVITWWGVSSCTPKIEVARAFLGANGRRVLFEVHAHRAVSIRRFSAYTQEEELVLAPGTPLRVDRVVDQAGGLSVVTLREESTLHAVS